MKIINDFILFDVFLFDRFLEQRDLSIIQRNNLSYRFASFPQKKNKIIIKDLIGNYY